MFSPDGTLISASAAPHCGAFEGGGGRERTRERASEREREREREHFEIYYTRIEISGCLFLQSVCADLHTSTYNRNNIDYHNGNDYDNDNDNKPEINVRGMMSEIDKSIMKMIIIIMINRLKNMRGQKPKPLNDNNSREKKSHTKASHSSPIMKTTRLAMRTQKV